MLAIVSFEWTAVRRFRYQSDEYHALSPLSFRTSLEADGVGERLLAERVRSWLLPPERSSAGTPSDTDANVTRAKRGIFWRRSRFEGGLSEERAFRLAFDGDM
jgi:hypothetical protein